MGFPGLQGFVTRGPIQLTTGLTPCHEPRYGSASEFQLGNEGPAIHTKGFLAGSISCDVGLLDLLEAGWFLEETISTEILSQNVCQG
ncbi:hypothetical protein Csa_022197 [Cucumis sativus]|uniref:Uncharacterized protein n=1 Tax=Cucumis sativus TaxID=3659 RepID=A0A0A0LL17_CUCSA|nr:hypothetical protein Csa_022197 [Cucumis sativus]